MHLNLKKSNFISENYSETFTNHIPNFIRPKTYIKSKKRNSTFSHIKANFNLHHGVSRAHNRPTAATLSKQLSIPQRFGNRANAHTTHGYCAHFTWP